MKRPRLTRLRWEILSGLVLVLGFALLALAAPLISPVQGGLDSFGQPIPPEVRIVITQKSTRPQPPGPQALLGTTEGKVDVFHSLVWGARDALRFGLLVGICAAALGTLVGAASGYLGGWIEWSLMRVTDGFLTFPLIAGVVLASELRLFITQQTSGIEARFLRVPGLELPNIDPKLEFLFSFQTVVILFSWMTYARLLNPLIARLKKTPFIEAARSLGAGTGRILFRHLIPNCISSVIVLLSRDIGGLVLLQAAMTFTGFGGDSVWGNVLVEGRRWIVGVAGNPFTNWWVFVPISLAIILFSIGWSLLGDGLNSLWNPYEKDFNPKRSA